MINPLKKLIRPAIFFAALLSGCAVMAQNAAPAPTLNIPVPAQPQFTPIAPNPDVNGFVLMDVYSGKILAAKNPDQRMEPASLTKMMTSYIISTALRAGRIHLDDLVPISAEAWKTGGSKMFVKVGDRVTVRDLMQGIIVDSGNDACVAMADFVAGSQEGFVNLMNQEAARLGMVGTHFMDVNGLPDPNHYSTPHDIALLAQALISDFPEDYRWYSQKWFTYNGIRQPNRNRLLWSDPSVDGVKTGHTEGAGFCLVASAQRNGMRLVSVVMGAPTDQGRAQSSQQLLTYGFRFFESHKLYAANTALTQARVWYGAEKQIRVGLARDFYVAIPAGQYHNLKVARMLTPMLQAPIKRGQPVGAINITLNNKPVASAPLVALNDDPKGGLWRRLVDYIRLKL
jgi:D-alanyl-D-alanine carboxypeptidase (penicillin-binding protein 5/6)